MIQQLIAIIKKDLRLARRDPRFIAPSLIVPFVLLTVYVTMWTTFAGGGEAFACGLVVEDQTTFGEQMASIIENMKSTTNHSWFTITRYDLENADSLYRQGNLISYILIPDGFGANISAGIDANVVMYINNANDDIVKNYVHRIEAAVLLYNQEALSPDFDQSNARVALEEELTLQLTPGNVEYAAAAAIILSLVTCSIAGQGLNTAAEFENKAIDDTLNSPLSRVVLVLGRTLAAIPRSMFVLLITYPVITIGMGVYPVGNPLILFGIIILAALALAPIGDLIGVVTKEKEPALLVAVILAVLGFLAGGGMAPIGLIPFQYRIFALLIPVTYVMTLWTRVFFIDTVTGLLPSVMALIVIWLLATLAVVALTKREVER